MKSTSKAKTPAQYIAEAPAERRAELRALHQAIRAAAPGLKPHLDYGMIGYGYYDYKYASGREGTWFVAGLASQKHHFSLYICACDENGYFVENNARRLGRVSTGKSCIRFKKLADLNLPVALELVRTAARLAPKRTTAKKQ